MLRAGTTAPAPKEEAVGCEAPNFAVEERPKFVLKDRGDGHRWCAEAGEDAGGGRGGGGEVGAEAEGLSLVVRDGTYAHPTSGEAIPIVDVHHEPPTQKSAQPLSSAAQKYNNWHDMPQKV